MNGSELKFKLHANATTTPEIRAYIQSSDKPVATLARELNVSEATVRRWKRRRTTTDRTTRPSSLRSTLSPGQEQVVVQLRQTFGLTLDKLFDLTRTHINPKVSRSGLHRCLIKHGVSRLADLRPLVFERLADLWSSEQSGEHIVVRAELVPIGEFNEGTSEKFLLAAQAAPNDEIQIAIKGNKVVSDDLKEVVKAAMEALAGDEVPKEVHLGPKLAEFWHGITA